MKKLDILLLQSNNDIPFEEARLVIHNPTLKEISMYGEEIFHIGLRFLVFDKKILLNLDESHLVDKGDFNIFMSVMSNPKLQAPHKTYAFKILDLLFPGMKISFKKERIVLEKENENIVSEINEQNYLIFKQILSQMFCLKEQEGQYNPKGGLAKKIAEKLEKAHQKINKSKGKTDRIGIYDQYVSILSVGLKKDKNILMNYTVYQIRDEFKRFIMKMNYDAYMQAKLAGATGMNEVEVWMEEIDSI